MGTRSVAGIVVFVVAASAHTPAAPQSSAPAVSPVVALLDRHLAGDHDGVIATLEQRTDLNDLLDGFERDAPTWIAARGPAEEQRRELTAVTLALEAARTGQWREWKVNVVVDRPNPSPFSHDPGVPPAYLHYWGVPPLLIEWACRRVREGRLPAEAERLWWLASLAVAERGQDYEFLVGDARPRVDYNTDPIQHVRHGQLRLPDEPRFKLAQGIAEERHLPAVARDVFERLLEDVDLGGEAAARLGVMAAAARQDDRALDRFRQVEVRTRDPWVLYLARFSAGRVHARANRPADAEREYRRALDAIPHAQSGAVALATLLFRDGRREEASAVITAMLAAEPAPADPWRGYADADDRFWPELVGQLRAVIRR